VRVENARLDGDPYVMSITARTIAILALALSLSALRTRAGEAEGEHEGGEHRHHVGLFLGNTYLEGENGATVGLDYEYRLSPLFGIGATLEYAGGDHDATIGATSLYLHPLGHWRLQVGPGVEREHGENEFLIRTGISYEFEFDRWTLAPTVNVDFVDSEESWVFGLAVGHKF